MNSKTYKIIKAIFLVLAIIIPLGVAALMCRYTYKRHLSEYEYTYFSRVKYDRKGNDLKDYHAQIDAYLKYHTNKYKLLATKTISYDNDRSLATLDIYEVINRIENVNETTNDTTYTYELTYYFIVYDVNYSSAYRLSEGKDDAEIPASNATPTLYLQIRNADDYNENTDATNYELNEDVIFNVSLIDYGATPTKIGTQEVQVIEVKASEMPSSKISVILHADTTNTTAHPDEPTEAKSRFFYTKEDPLAVDVFYIDINEEMMSTFTDGFNSDALAAGYTKYIFKTFWWWETLVSIILVGALTGVFYLVITYREDEEE